jgi:hypothetical protein
MQLAPTAPFKPFSNEETAHSASPKKKHVYKSKQLLGMSKRARKQSHTERRDETADWDCASPFWKERVWLAVHIGLSSECMHRVIFAKAGY